MSEMYEYRDLRQGLAYGLMLPEDAREADVLAEVLRISRAANEHFDLLARAADAWTTYLDAPARNDEFEVPSDCIVPDIEFR
jgi:hypothetical protein